jgi:hypothetical protein
MKMLELSTPPTLFVLPLAPQSKALMVAVRALSGIELLTIKAAAMALPTPRHHSLTDARKVRR